jgi:hypothetical protein
MSKAPKAVLLLRRKRYFDDDAISEVILWRVPESVPGSSHRLKYRLFNGYPGRGAVAYDNESGKGDHRHRNGREESFVFVSLDHC